MKKIQTWAVVNWDKIIKAGFPTATAAFEWMQAMGVDAVVARVWI